MRGFCKTANIIQVDVGANLPVYANPVYTSTLGIFGKQSVSAGNSRMKRPKTRQWM